MLAALLVTLGSPVHANCRSTCKDDVAVCRRTRCVGHTGAERRRCVAECRARAGCGGGFGTLAYVVSSCRVQGSSQIGAQELRIRRNGCDPVTVLRFANPEPAPDPFGLCARGAQNHNGVHSGLAGIFQRLGVTRDGSAVVFEISNQFQLIGKTPLAPEQQGFFYVRADGTGLRRLAPPSRDSTYRIFVNPRGEASAESKTALPFRADDRMTAYTDLGPGADGRESEQIFTLDLRTGERKQVTRLVGTAPPDRRLVGGIAIGTYRGGIGFDLLIGEEYTSFSMRSDGSDLHSVPSATVGGRLDGPVLPTLGLTTRTGLSLHHVAMPGTPENPWVFLGAPIYELFLKAREHLIQLTALGHTDTRGLAFRPDEVLLMASADPFGTNPSRNCQLFRAPRYGGPLRQLTHFGQGVPSEEGCQLGELPGCGISYGVEQQLEVAARARAYAFYSDCDPFGTNPDGSQVFAIDWGGSRLRQLTHTAGARRGADGSLELELLGPAARGGR